MIRLIFGCEACWDYRDTFRIPNEPSLRLLLRQVPLGAVFLCKPTRHSMVQSVMAGCHNRLFQAAFGANWLEPGGLPSMPSP